MWAEPGEPDTFTLTVGRRLVLTYNRLFGTRPSYYSNLASVPVTVVASENRPQYLYRALRSLMTAQGSLPQNFRVYVDGTTKREALEVCDLLGVKGQPAAVRGASPPLPSEAWREGFCGAHWDTSSPLAGTAQEPHGIKNARISQHYLSALSAVFDEFVDDDAGINCPG